MKKLWCNNYTHTPLCKWVLEEVLGMESYSLNVNSCVFLEMGKGGYFEPPDRVFISQDLKYPDNVKAIFHELRHYYQFKTGMFEFKPEPYLRTPDPSWDIVRMRLERYLDYLQYPWELDAKEFEMETMRKFWKTSFASDLSLIP